MDVVIDLGSGILVTAKLLTETRLVRSSLRATGIGLLSLENGASYVGGILVQLVRLSVLEFVGGPLDRGCGLWHLFTLKFGMVF